MRLVRSFLVFLVFVVIAAFLLSWFLPAEQKIERTITIRAHARDVYQKLLSLENLKTWLVWAKGDSSSVYTLSGTDGQPGASLFWKGDPAASGEGRVTLTGIETNRLVSHDFNFISPRTRIAHSELSLKESGDLTTVTWTFTMKTPRPWNIANLFYSMDKDMGKGFDEGLALLKANLEQKEGFTDGNKTKFKVERYDFPSTNFALIRQKVKWSDLSGFFLQHYPILFDAISKAGVATGGASSLIYEWDEKSHLADIAAAVPVPAGTKLDNDIITFQEIPASKALLVNYKGPYNNESEAYKAIRDYMRENSLKQKGPSIEQYISGPANESDSSRWLTKIVFLVE